MAEKNECLPTTDQIRPGQRWSEVIDYHERPLGLGMHSKNKLELSSNILNPHSSIKEAQILKYP